MDSLVNGLAAEIFPPEGSEVNPMANMPHHRMVMRSYGYATKPWVGLTEQEKLELKNTNMPTMALIDTVCALLKAQNHD